MRRIGHRGAMGHAPENTIASFQKALDLACDEVETDVWLTQDGRLLVSHDRPTTKTKLSLDEVLDFCRGRMAVNVEVKSEKDEDRARETGARVAAHLAARRGGDVYVSSFWWSALEGARAAAPAVRRAFVFSDSPDRAALLGSARALELWALHPNRAYLTPDLIRAAHAASLRVNTWTVNDAKEITTFRNWSVDGIMSDYPERVPKE
ncbi:MAG TPA: glycerophosphodiester phosphodiesterase [Candidatus Limnocylindria bacterium]|nr:glycerophosphodiester phosphodiesterase [Candidatus Limnocylindria bacterium]